ncbi:torsin-3A [Hyperolius riggenbachi]|uniref:torsin-3A n=1 Tax=Hyperolius riggenbachi TaxID=752182 RepID=UPI0035A312CA
MHRASILLLLISSSLVLSTEQGDSGLAEQSQDAKDKDSVWFSGAPEVQDLAQLSWEYVHGLQCWLWPDKCEEKSDPADWNWNSLGWDSLNVLTDLYTRVTDLTDPTQRAVTNNITGLHWDLERRVHGQHQAVKQILSSLERFLQEDGNTHQPLVLSFHGWTGTGKNLVARIMAENLYHLGLRNRCTKVFIPQLHFPHQSHVESYKVQLGKQMREISSRCAQPLFVFDEADKLPAALLEPLLPLLRPAEDHPARSIFIFLSATGSSAINEVTLNFWRAGRHREEITLDDMDRPLKTAIRRSEDYFLPWHLLQEGLVSDFVPFLPLERAHVRLCVRDVFTARGLSYTESSVESLLQELVFVPKDERIFSAQGCKKVAQRIHFSKARV